MTDPEAGEILKNMEYMETWAARGFDKDPFKIKSDNAMERQVLDLAILGKYQNPKGDLPLCSDHGFRQLFGTSRYMAAHEKAKKRLYSRVAYALVGGLGLLIPMITMVYVPGTTASVATTCAFMLLFALGLAWFSDAQPREILTISAGYAAFLVVFVGVRITPSIG